LRKDPANEEARKNLGLALSQMAKKARDSPPSNTRRPVPATPNPTIDWRSRMRRKAISKKPFPFSEVLKIKPDHFRAQNDMGVILARTGRLDEAIAHFREALRVKPDFKEAEYNLKVATAQKPSSR